MKYKTSELDGALLDCAAALANGIKAKVFTSESLGPDADGKTHEGDVCCIAGHGETGIRAYKPSSNWAHGGPIIERARIEIHRSGDEWCAQTESAFGAVGDGRTALEAAMRSFVEHKLGDEVDL